MVKLELQQRLLASQEENQKLRAELSANSVQFQAICNELAYYKRKNKNANFCSRCGKPFMLPQDSVHTCINPSWGRS